MRRNALLIALAAPLLAAPPLGAQVVDAILLDPRGRDPVSGAEVALLDGAGATVAHERTRADGRVRLRAPAAGSYRVRATRGAAVLAEGAVELPAEGTVDVEMRSGTLAAARSGEDAVALEPLVAEAAARRRYLDHAGFYDRQRTSSGVFLTGRQFADRSGARLIDRLSGMRGIFVRPAGASGWVIYQRVPPSARGGGGRCMASLWVDGRQEAARILNNVPPGEVEAVEVYEATEVPFRFAPVNRGGRPVCGAVVIWLKTPIA